MNELEQKNLLQTEAQVSDELSMENLEEIAGGGLGASILGGLAVGVGAAAFSLVGSAIKGDSLQEAAGDALAIGGGAATATAGALLLAPTP